MEYPREHHNAKTETAAKNYPAAVDASMDEPETIAKTEQVRSSARIRKRISDLSAAGDSSVKFVNGRLTLKEGDRSSQESISSVPSLESVPFVPPLSEVQ